MIESKSIKVGVSQEQHYIDVMQKFGWTLNSSQEINVKESHLESRGDTVYSVTTGENYIKLVFKRDTAIKNYSRLKQLENQYFDVLNRQPSPMSGKIAFLGILFFVVPGALYIAVKVSQKKKWEAEMMDTAYPALSEAEKLL